MGDAKAVTHLVHFHIHLVSTAGFVAVGQIVITPQLLLGGVFRHFLLQKLHFIADAHNFIVGRAQNLLHRKPCGKLGNLGNQTQPLVGIDIDFAVIKVNLPG